MSIIRTSKTTDPYARIENDTLRDDRLSWKARGLLAFLLSMPDNWQTNIKHLASVGPDGEAAVRAGLTELAELGYLVRQRVRDGKGHVLGWTSTVYERPTETRLSDVGFPDVGLTERGLPERGKPPRIRTTKTKNDVVKELPTTLVVSDDPPPEVPIVHMSDVRQVFGLWQEVTNHPNAVLDKKRETIIRKALRLFPLEDVEAAVRGWKWSPFHQGHNDRGTVYDGLHVILRDSDHIERFRDWERGINRPHMPMTKKQARVLGNRLRIVQQFEANGKAIGND